jgi:hypothetical protein
MIPPRVVGSYFDATVRHIDANTPEQQPQVPAFGSPSGVVENPPKTFRLRSPTVTAELADYIKTLTPSFLTPAQNASNIIRAAIKSTWKIDIDPDQTRQWETAQ